MSIKNILITVILALIVSIPFVTKAYDNQGPTLVRNLKDISYVDTGKNPAQTLDLYLPTKTKSAAPLIVFIHGGAWLQGSKDEAQQGLGVFFCRQGFAVASINYRLSQEAIFPAQIEDCKAAIRFLRAHAQEYNIDPTKIGVWGVSAGGHLVSLLGTSGGVKELEGNLGNAQADSSVQAVADWCGPSDLVSIAEQAGSRTKIDFDSADGCVAKLLGGLQTAKHEQAVAASPVTYIDKNDPPFLIVHGDLDDLVPYAQAQELQEKLNAAGVPNKLITISGGGHAFTTEEQLNHVADFFKETLVKGNRKFTLSE